LPYAKTDLFKKVWLSLKKGTAKEDLGVLTPEEEAIVLLVQREINLWVAYYAMKDFNPKLAAIEKPEDAIQIMKKHPMIEEIVQKCLSVTAIEPKGEKKVEFFRNEQVISDSREEVEKWNPHNKKGKNDKSNSV